MCEQCGRALKNAPDGSFLSRPQFDVAVASWQRQMTAIILPSHPRIELRVVDLRQHSASVGIALRPLGKRLLYGFLLLACRRCFRKIDDLPVRLCWMLITDGGQLLIQRILNQFYGAPAMGAECLGVIGIMHQFITGGAKKPAALVRDVADSEVEIVFTHRKKKLIYPLPYLTPEGRTRSGLLGKKVFGKLLDYLGRNPGSPQLDADFPRSQRQRLGDFKSRDIDCQIGASKLLDDPEVVYHFA